MDKLTDREREVAYLVMEGLENREIAKRLFVSRHTVKAELSNIYQKLNIDNRVQLAIYCYNYNVKKQKTINSTESI